MALKGTELARRSDGRVEIRADALRLRVQVRDVATADIHLIDIDFTCSVRALDQRGEREMFEEVFLSSRDAATVEDVAHHFTPALRQAMCAVAVTQPAAHWLNESNKQAIVETFRSAAKPVAFSSGTELLPPFEVIVTSRTMQREKLDEMEQKLAQRRHAGHVENVQRATELLKEFAALQQTMPGVSPGRLLQQVVPANRGTMLQSLLMASAADATAQLWAVAGANLLKIDPRATPPKVTTIPLPSDLGPLRSVQGDGGRLLIGAQSGVIIVDRDRPGEATLLRDAQTQSQLGFNSAASTGATVWATHSDSGVIAWDEANPAEPQVALRELEGRRQIDQLDDTRVLFTAGGQVLVADAARAPTVVSNAAAAVVFVHVNADGLVIVRESGEVETLDRETLQSRGTHRRAGQISSAGALPWLGSDRLLLADKDGPIHCVGGDDPLVTQYLSSHRGLRAVAASAEIVAALSADRQRIVLWNSWSGDAPFAEIHVASIARNRAADICFA